MEKIIHRWTDYLSCLYKSVNEKKKVQEMGTRGRKNSPELNLKRSVKPSQI